MKLIFMGTPNFALPSLNALLDSEHDVVAVYTQPPRPAGRGQQLRPSPVHRLAEEHDLPVYTPTSLKDDAVQQEFAALGADIAVIVAYGLLLPTPILHGTKLGCVNVHPSLLPRWRGAAPIERPIIAGDSMTGVCIMHMEEGLDTGPVYSRVEVPIPPDANSGSMHDVLANLGGELLPRTLQAITEGLNAEPQSSDGTTYAEKIQKNETHLHFNQPVSDIANLIRGLSPRPAAHFHYNNEIYKIIRANYAKIPHDFACGTTINDQLHIACEGGILQPTVLQRQGKQAVDIDSFLRGNPIPAGTIL